ncbi:Hypothetical protein NG00_00119 [Corynebacterium camporealensis]|uniref:DUF202 domain-containing protein n=1 Tax=Corynebacterium camporealensis TaxID=161896 RepID=A0A0F6T9H4_9CORY|nr:DUF202 domain-containing protein [Corynebacterium camporealensis]AKE38129.1 hypothetical protein UL81_00690 [Corynebacterium camporealensis]AVH87449.1 Hypothetical protein NG00_00119 [Corynebacterium camporealensis]MDY5839762.1 DUF202 domain-containing protein [Corynebacterium camporealensis]
MPSQLFDPGLQPERTRLSWQRTALAFILIMVTAARIVGFSLTAIGILLVIVACWLVWAVRRRAVLIDASLAHTRPLPGGGVLAVLAGLTSVLAIGIVLGLYL